MPTPTTNENKVQFGLKNVYYAILSETESSGTITQSWGTPVPVRGAVNLVLDQQGEVTPFYADDMVYYRSVNNNGYSGDLEMARFPDQMLQDVWGMTLGSTSKVLTENANVKPKSFALLYQIDGDENNECFVLYNCTANRPGVGSSTKTESAEPQTQSVSISAVPLINGNVLARTTKDTPTATKTGWFSSVFVES